MGSDNDSDSPSGNSCPSVKPADVELQLAPPPPPEPKAEPDSKKPVRTTHRPVHRVSKEDISNADKNRKYNRNASVQRRTVLNGTAEVTEPKGLATLKKMRRQTQLGLPIPSGDADAWRWKLCVTMDSFAVQSITMFVLFLALFFGDLIIICTDTEDADLIISVVLLFVLIFFTIDMLLQCIARDDYINSFFFYMDVLGTFSLVTEIMWISSFLRLDRLQEGNSSLLRASRTSRVGARAARMTKLVRLLRVFRMTRVMKWVSAIMNKKETAEADQAVEHSTSLIAVRLSESISKQVAALTMVAILFTPFLTYTSVESVSGAYTDLFETYVGKPCDAIEPLAQSFNDEFDNRYGQKAIDLTVGDCFYQFNNEPKREKDIREITGNQVTMNLDVSTENDEIAGFNIGLYLFVVFLLCFFSLLQNGTCNRLLVEPLELMFNKLQEVASQLFTAMAIEVTEEGAGTEEIGAMNAILYKMSRLVQHVTSNEGSHKLQEILDDENLSADARDYVLDMTHKLDHSSADTEKPLNSDQDKSSTEDYSVFFPEKVDCSKLESWNFDVLELTNEQIFSYVLAMFEELGLLTEDLVQAKKLRKLLELLVLNYKPNPYHNFKHITDVTHTVYRIISVCFATTPLSDLERLAMMVAALAHDLQHPGQNNMYLIQIKDPLATTYNDLSVLENLHVATLFSIFQEHPEADVLCNLSSQNWRDVRKMMVGMILHTDMTKHFEMVSKLDVILELKGDGDMEVDKNYFSTQDDRQILINLILHASDISNPCKPLPICQKWTEYVLQEFFEQGDLERSRNMSVSPNMDRNNTNKPLSQVNFIDYIVAPLWGNTARLLPATQELLENLLHNRRHWGERYEAEVLADPTKTEAEKNEERAKIRQKSEKFFKMYGPIIWGEDVEPAEDS